MPNATTCSCYHCKRPPRPAVLRDCVHCGQPFESRRGRTRCSPECRRARDRASLAASSKARGTDYRKRAEHFGVEYQSFSRLSIFERDEWRCGICGSRVNPNLVHPEPMSASLDHVVPLSLGGPHVPDNAQCSHLICNIEKGARLISPMR